VWWVQLSTAIIFGLGFSTMLTLILVPVLLAAPTIIRERRSSKSGREMLYDFETPKAAE
jgi:multidrug efflux pump